MNDDDIDDAITNGVAAIESVQHERGSPESEASAEEDAVALTKLGEYTKRLREENAAMRLIVEAIIAAQNAVTSAEARWHQVTRTDSYPESEVRQADRQRVTALRTRDAAIEQARAYVAWDATGGRWAASWRESAGGDDE